MSRSDTLPVMEVLPISAIQDPKFEVRGTLYFLEAQYLFRWMENGSLRTKFLSSLDLAAAFNQTEQDTGWMPAGVVRAGNCAKGAWYVYSSPEQKVTVTLDPGEEPVTIPIPRLVMMGIGATYYLWAVKGVHFNPDEPAYKAPFPNVYSDGRICWGANSPGPVAPKAARGIWDLFFSAPFNKDLVDGKSKTDPDDVRKALHRLADKNRYPVGDLLETREKINYLVDMMVGA